MHGMTKFVIFGITSKEETLLAHIEIETLKAAITEANYGIFFANVTFRLRNKKEKKIFLDKHKKVLIKCQVIIKLFKLKTS